jgi:hypothetical protein
MELFESIVNDVHIFFFFHSVENGVEYICMYIRLIVAGQRRLTMVYCYGGPEDAFHVSNVLYVGKVFI